MKTALALLFAALGVFAQPVITGNIVVRAGETRTFNASEPVTWSLRTGSAGTLDSVTATTAQYTAPTGFRAHQTVGGCQVLPNDHIEAVKISGLPVHAASATQMAALSDTLINVAAGSMFYNVLDSTAPRHDFVFNYTPHHNGEFPYPAWPFKSQGGTFLAGPGMGVSQVEYDRHVYSIQRPTPGGHADDCVATEIYKRYARTDWVGDAARYGKDAASGVRYSLESYDLKNVTTNAAGVLGIPLKLKLSDIQSGTLKHPLGVTFVNPAIGDGFIWPATSEAGNASVTGPPYGSRLRLKADFDISGFSAIAQIILQGFKDYGLVIVDGGGNWDVWCEAELGRDPAVVAALAEIRGSALRGRTHFEVVDTDAVNPGATGMRPSNLLGYVDAQEYQAVTGEYPAQYAELCATNGSSQTTCKRIMLRAVTVGTSDVSFVMLGGQTVPVTAWVGGSDNQQIDWSATGGSIVSTGTGSANFTAPNPATKTTYTINAAANADSGAVAKIIVHVLPAGDGVIRIDLGSTTNTTDVGGNTWWNDGGMYEGYSFATNIPSSNWPNDEGLRTQHATARYTRGDLIMDFRVPNGNYQGRLCGTKPDTRDDWLEEHIDVNRQIVEYDFNLSSTTYTRFAGAYPHYAASVLPQWTVKCINFPAVVTDGSLYIATRGRGNHGNLAAADSLYDQIHYSTLQIAPATGPTQITLDAEYQYESLYKGALRRTESVVVHPVYWWMGKGVTWSLDGPGTLTPEPKYLPDVDVASDGVRYTAPSTPTTGTATITATSTVDPSRTAQIQFNLEFGDVLVTPTGQTLYRGNTQQFAAYLGAVAPPQVGLSPYSGVTWQSSGAGRVHPTTGVWTAPIRMTVAEDSATVTATSTHDASKTGAASVSVLKVSPPLYLDTGHPLEVTPVTDGTGNTWTDGDSPYYSCAATCGNGYTATAITGTSNSEENIYKTWRSAYNNLSPGGFTFTYPVASGLYEVRLMWGGIPAAQSTSMDVRINDVVVLDDFNPNSGGTYTAVDRTFQVAAIDGSIRINVRAGSTSGAFWSYLCGVQITFVRQIGSFFGGANLSGVRLQ